MILNLLFKSGENNGPSNPLEATRRDGYPKWEVPDRNLQEWWIESSYIQSAPLN